ncbi:MAG TPA: UDP-N-acetylmuramoyl-L-alanine--D-glutamate ligase [Rhodobiaceae bacterium]|nr:UDP-N-acetylmuramoyl-L-alanine--D-glutamate ligase [Rhodobiaceae bacterium]
MISLPTYDGETAVFGLGRSGLSAVRALIAAGNNVVAWDDNAQQRAAAAQAGAQIRDIAENFGAPARLVLSPGVPLTHPQPHNVVKAAKAAGVPVVGDVELFADAVRLMNPAPNIVAVTGTNGKSTTSALIAHLVSACGGVVQLGGNIGHAVLDLDMPETDTPTVYVLELSSYQIDLLDRFKADIAVLTNFSADHLDRHGNMAGYIHAKSRLFDMLSADGTAIIGVDDADSRGVADRVQASGLNVCRIGAHGAADIFWQAGALTDGTDALVDLQNAPALRGAHNGQNAAAACAVLRGLGYEFAQLQDAFTRFPGLEHRLQPVAIHENLIFVNDSKATNAEATRHALAAYDNIYWIVGGRAKDDGLANLEDFYTKIRAAFLIGEAAERFQRALEGHLTCHMSGTLDKAVRTAADLAASDLAASDLAGDDHASATILLSPACASFDQFPDFEARGAAFCAAVEQWQSKAPTSQAPTNQEGASC